MTCNSVYQDMRSKIDEDTPYETVHSMVEYLIKHQMISTREAAIMMQAITAAYEVMEPENRVQLLHTLLLTLERME